MKFRNISKRSCYVLIMLMGVTGLAMAENHKPDSRLKFLGKLIETSSGARRVEHSANEQALALREEARALYEQAKNSKDPEQVGSLLDAGYKKMFAAVRAASAKEVNGKKKARDFNEKAKSVKSLLEAQQRVSAEKNLSEQGDAIKVQAQALVEQAQAYHQKGEHDGAIDLLNKAYDLIKGSIESMRGGDTLVRSLNFASKEEEYHYELDRNDTHLMLLRVLGKEKKTTSSTVKRVEQFIVKAKEMRLEAERSAKRGKYETAINFMESSTKQVVRAIRSAGTYIPG